MPYFDLGTQPQLRFDPHFPVTRTTIAPRLASPLGGGVSQLRRRYQRVLYQFTLRDAQADKARADWLLGFLTYMQGDTAFFWDGGAWGVVASPAFVGFGDGVRTQFYLPNRHITGNLVVYCNSALVEPTPGLDGTVGLITVLPGLVGEIEATYSCTYRVTVWNESEALYQEENLASGLFSQNGLVLREFIP